MDDLKRIVLRSVQTVISDHLEDRVNDSHDSITGIDLEINDLSQSETTVRIHSPGGPRYFKVKVSEMI
jgi:hypothetical protein